MMRSQSALSRQVGYFTKYLRKFFGFAEKWRVTSGHGVDFFTKRLRVHHPLDKRSHRPVFGAFDIVSRN